MEVVCFMLHDAGLPAGEPLFHGLAGSIGVPQLDVPMASHDGLVSGDRQAPFEERGCLRSQGLVRRVDDGEELQLLPVPHSGRRRVNLVFVLKDGQLKGDAQLRSSQAHARSVMHDLTHPINECQQLNVVYLAIKGGRNMTQDRMTRLDNCRKPLCVKQPSDSIPDLRGVEVGGGAGRLGMRLMRHAFEPNAEVSATVG